MNIPHSTRRVVIIGGGFAGVAVAKGLRRSNFQVVLIDKHNYHNFQPLLYQVATGGLEAGSIAYPLRKIFQEQSGFFFRLGQVREIDTANKKVLADIGEVTYDYLIIATGSKTNYFGNRDIERFSMAMKTIPQSLNLRSLILENFEQAVLTDDVAERKALMNFCLVGGGPTGVELAGVLAEMKHAIFQKDYPDLNIAKMEINLIQSGDRILNTMSEKSSAAAEDFLKKLGVNIIKNTRVLNYDGNYITTNSDVKFHTHTVIWTAGVQGAAIPGIPVSSLTEKQDRYLVNEFSQVAGFVDVFAIGDVALMASEAYPQGHPMMAQPAMQQGKHLAQTITSLAGGQMPERFVYKDKGSMATIGRNKAVVDLPRYHFHGFLAWFVWIFVHLFSLIGFRNKVVVMLNWMYNYVHLDREGRLIIRPYKRKPFSSFTTDEI